MKQNDSREKTRVEKHIAIVNSITKLEELMKEHNIPDELVGDTVLIDYKKVMEFISVMKNKMTENFSVELKRKETMYRPLKSAIKTMNDERRRNTYTSKTEDGNGKTSLGEIRKQAPFGGVKIDKD